MAVIRVSELTDEESWALLRLKRWSDPVQKALLWNVARSENKSYASIALDKKYFEGLSGAAKLLSTLNSKARKSYKNSPLRLAQLIATNPKGKARAELIDTICKKKAAAEHALLSAARFTASEKKRLVECALASTNVQCRAWRAKSFLKRHKDWSPHMRSVLVKNLISLSRPTYAMLDVLEKPSDFFSKSAPMTEEERSLFLTHAYWSAEWCAEKLKFYGIEGTDEFQFSEEEARQAIPGALLYLRPGPTSLHRVELAQALLNNKMLLPLLTPEHVKNLQGVKKYDAA